MGHDGWKGVGETKVVNCLALMTPSRSAGSAMAQPVFHPVQLKDLGAEETATVREAIPGREAMLTCLVPKVRFS
ncbi:hypothetical protein HMPREF1261_01957 [Corynebacterium sp. KPL1818]|jgi:hypothetical protein|nr:hypothetical protein HMPREF1261_01957 [Corynebacterium sp. KPL1818]